MAKSTQQGQASRLPSTRESRPALIALAIILIVGGALGSAWLAIQSGNRAFFVQVKNEVAQGAVISSDDLTRVSLPEDYANGVRSSQSDSIVGQAATTRLLPGTVLTRDMVSKKSGIAANQTQLTIPVDASPFVEGLQPGAQMALAVGGDNGRRAVYAELVSVGKAEDGGLGTAGSEVPIIVSIDLSCLSVVAQGIEDNAVTAALTGESDVPKTCGA